MAGETAVVDDAPNFLDMSYLPEMECMSLSAVRARPGTTDPPEAVVLRGPATLLAVVRSYRGSGPADDQGPAPEPGQLGAGRFQGHMWISPGLRSSPSALWFSEPRGVCPGSAQSTPILPQPCLGRVLCLPMSA